MPVGCLFPGIISDWSSLNKSGELTNSSPLPTFSQYGLQTLYGVKKKNYQIKFMKRQQETYLTKFLYRIQTLFLCQEHTAVGLTWQNHLLESPTLQHTTDPWRRPSWVGAAFVENAKPIATELCWVVFSPTLPSVHLDGTVTWVYYKHKTEQAMWAKYNCLAQMGVCIFMRGQETSTPTGQKGALRTRTLQKHSLKRCLFKSSHPRAGALTYSGPL